MFLETIVIRLPTPETPVIAIPSSHMYRLRKRFIHEGKLICMNTIRHPNNLVQVTARIFRDKKAFDEWHADPIVQAQRVLYMDHYDRNKIGVSQTTDQI